MNPSLLMLKPAPGVLVRDPATRLPLPPEGGTVPDTTYWRRRLAEGDVLPAQAPETPTAKTKATTTRSAQ